ncbi:O-antigen ligase family protein [Microbacteriaceae bacterium K1510]|nr:O-antigen ligase family protein [Microbacteriaceae bacterium K1510]
MQPGTHAAAPWVPAFAGVSGPYSITPPVATPLSERILLAVLFITVFASSIAFIEPSPHDGLMGLLAVACVIAGARFDSTLVVPLVLLLVWNISGLSSLLRVLQYEKTLQYAATSVYLGVAALIFACLFASNTMPRLKAMRAAYVSTACFAAVLGAIGYFNVFPGAAEMFAKIGRANGAFKDPNVFGPFLIWPALITLERLLVRRIALTDLLIAGTILFGLLLSFSRGAWFHFSVSVLVMIALAILTAPDHKTRLRIVTLTAIAVGAFAVLLVILLSIDSIGGMFKERAQLIQSYDVGSGGRFRLQEIALSSILNFPNGMGPFEFARVHGLQQHNVYLQAFLVYGWVGAMAYFLLLITTILVGLRCAFVRTPWQPYMITAVAVFIGEVAEGFVIDTDHWRHFFLLLGMIWGLAAATFREARRPQNIRPAGWAGGPLR